MSGRADALVSSFPVLLGPYCSAKPCAPRC